jgi:excisionase family DNA binding protein
MLRDGDVKWVPVRTAAKMLGVSMKRVYQLIESGTLSSMKVDCTVLVSVRSVESRQMLLPGVKDAA